MTAKIGNCIRYTSDCRGAIVPRVVRLLNLCGPTAVLLAVVAFVINAVQRQSSWPLPHVFQEVLEGIQPSFTDNDSSSSVIAVGIGTWVIAPSFHLHPTFVGGRFGHSVAVLPAMEAAFGSSGFEVGIVADRLASTDTAAHTECLPVTAWRVRDDCKLAEGLSDERRFGWHNGSALLQVVGVRRQPALTAIMRNWCHA